MEKLSDLECQPKGNFEILRCFRKVLLDEDYLTYMNFFAKKCFYAISPIYRGSEVKHNINVVDSRMRATLYIQFFLIKCDNQLLI